jgi:hypothetical protein
MEEGDLKIWTIIGRFYVRKEYKYEPLFNLRDSGVLFG